MAPKIDAGASPGISNCYQRARLAKSRRQTSPYEEVPEKKKTFNATLQSENFPRKHRVGKTFSHPKGDSIADAPTASEKILIV